MAVAEDDLKTVSYTVYFLTTATIGNYIHILDTVTSVNMPQTRGHPTEHVYMATIEFFVLYTYVYI